MTEAERVLSRAQTLMAMGKAKSWSRAIAVAADTVRAAPPASKNRPEVNDSGKPSLT